MRKVLRPALPFQKIDYIYSPSPAFQRSQTRALSRVRSTAKPLALDYASGSDTSGTGGGDIKSIAKDQTEERIGGNAGSLKDLFL